MKLSRWKSVLSYFADIPLQTWTSEKNGRMQVSLSRGELKLSTDNAVYSFGINYRSFAFAFDELSLMGNERIKSVLVLGWGLGSIADLLNNHPSITNITGVEHDDTLVEYFQQVRSLQYSFQTDIINQDAIAFVKNENLQFDLVCSDIFIDNKTPAAIISKEYLRTLTQMASIGGIILLSKLSVSMSDKNQNSELEETLRACGYDYSVINTIGNRMYYWENMSQI